MSENNKIKDIVEASTALAEAVPIYQDLVQPTAQELGKGLHTLSKTIHIALSPVSALVWGYEKIANYLQNTLEEKFKNTDPEKITQPDISIAGPAIEAMRFTGDKDHLRKLFASLIASSMNSDTSHLAHPAYVEIIKQLSSDEAKILKCFNTGYFPFISVYFKQHNHNVNLIKYFSDIADKAGCENPENILVYLDNLVRLNLIFLDDTVLLVGDHNYETLENHKSISKLKNDFSNYSVIEFKRGIGKTTEFGLNFHRVCIKD